MKILVVCGVGLGSSFMIELNVKKVLKELGIEAEVSHTDLTTGKSEKADYYIGSPEIMEQLEDGSKKTISLINLFSLSELTEAINKNILKR
jgi:PTS system ascorbate-specific IIB component